MARAVSAIGALSAIPDFVLAAVFLAAWIGVAAVPADAPSYLLSLLLIEFFVIHSAGFTAAMVISRSSRAYRAVSLLGLSMAFGVPVRLVGRRYNAEWAVLGFAMLTVNRLVWLLLGPAREAEREFMVESWIGALSLLAGCVLVSALAPIPRLGAAWVEPTHTLPALLGFRWLGEPNRFLACGFGYFALHGLSEATDYAWVDRAARRYGSWLWGAFRTRSP